MSESVLNRPDLDLKACLELFQSSPFSLDTFLKIRGEVLQSQLKSCEDDYLGIISIIRGKFSDFLRQAFTIYNDKDSENIIFRFINRFLFNLIANLRKLLIKSTNIERPQLTHMWHSTIIAGEALKPYSADFSPALEDIFVSKTIEIIREGLNERLNDLEIVCSDNDVIINNEKKFDLNTTIALNSVVDAINQVYLCPKSQSLVDQVIIEFKNRPKLSENIKQWAIKQF